MSDANLPAADASGDESLATAPIASARRVHVPALDGFRGFGIVGVMIVHFVGFFAGIDPSAPDTRSGLPRLLDVVAFVCGIQLFFVLSGFLITGILLEAREKPGYFRNFFARRVLRIFPLYYGVLVILFLLHPAWGRALGGSSSPRWLWLYLSNLEIAHRGRLSYGYLSHFWSLAVEEQYYLFWPLVVLAFRPRRLLAVCGILGLSSFAIRMALTAGGRHNVAAYVLTACQLDPLCTGGALAILVRKWPASRFRVFARAAIIAALSGYAVLSLLHLSKLDRGQLVARPLLSCLLFGGAILLATGGGGILRRILATRPWPMLGKYSYGLYVFHCPLSPLFAMCFPHAAIGRSLGSPIAGLLTAVLLSILATLVLAIASYELVEKRFLRLKALFPE